MMIPEHSPDRHGTGGKFFLNQDSAAELLGLSTRTLERFRLEGRGPAFRKFGRRVLYAQADVMAWADAQRRTSTSECAARPMNDG